MSPRRRPYCGLRSLCGEMSFFAEKGRLLQNALYLAVFLESKTALRFLFACIGLSLLKSYRLKWIGIYPVNRTELKKQRPGFLFSVDVFSVTGTCWSFSISSRGVLIAEYMMERSQGVCGY